MNRQSNNKSLDKGVGDTLARIIADYTTVKPCGGCNKRKDTLNEWFPYNKTGE